MADEEFCDVTTTGRRSGRAHTIEIWFARNEGKLYLLSGGGDRSDWVRNLLAYPSVSVRLGGEEIPMTARVVPDDDPAQPVARRLLAARYQGWHDGEPLSAWATEALLVELAP